MQFSCQKRLLPSPLWKVKVLGNYLNNWHCAPTVSIVLINRLTNYLAWVSKAQWRKTIQTSKLFQYSLSECGTQNLFTKGSNSVNILAIDRFGHSAFRIMPASGRSSFPIVSAFSSSSLNCGRSRHCKQKTKGKHTEQWTEHCILLKKSPINFALLSGKGNMLCFLQEKRHVRTENKFRSLRSATSFLTQLFSHLVHYTTISIKVCISKLL